MPDDLDPRIVELMRRVPSARLLFEGDAPLTTWAAVRELTAIDLHTFGIPPKAKHAIRDAAALRGTYSDRPKPEPAWAVELDPARHRPKIPQGCAACSGGRILTEVRVRGVAPLYGSIACPSCCGPAERDAFVADARRRPDLRWYAIGETRYTPEAA